MEYKEDGTSAILLLQSEYGQLQIELNEKEIIADTDIENLAIILVYERENVYGKIGNDDKTFANHNGSASLSYIKKAEVKDGTIEFLFENFTYSVILRRGKISDDFKITAENGKIKAEIA